MIEDDRGIGPELNKLFNTISIETELVNDLPENPTHVINLRGLNKFENNTLEQITEANRDSFLMAKTCAKNLFEGEGSFLLAFDSGLGHESLYGRAWSGGISALAKTAQLEWPAANVQSVNIDCYKKDPSTIALELFGAITSGGLSTEIEIDAEGKLFQLTPKASEIKHQTNGLQNGDTIVVSGGAKGVTADCLIALTERKKLNIGILGRTKLEQEPDYLTSYKTEAELKNAVYVQAVKDGIKLKPIEISKIVSNILGNREIVENIRILTESGARVKYLAVDILIKEDVIAAVNNIRNDFGHISGLIHAAGVLADKWIHEKTEEQFNKVFNTKITGFQNLLAATAIDDLSHICCFSSVAARLGNKGQVDYAMANEVLNKVCRAEQKKRKNTCLVKSINWGPWEGGMVSSELKKHFESLGVALIPLKVGAEMFADEMEDSSFEEVEIVVGGTFKKWGHEKTTDEKNTYSMWVHRHNNGFLIDHMIEGRVVVPMMMANEWCLRLAKILFPALNVIDVENMKVLKGIQLENFETNGDVLYFVFNIEEKEEIVSLNIKIKNEKSHVYYSASINLSGNKLSTPQYSPILKDLKQWSWGKKQIYNTQLFHGPDFQVVEKLTGISPEGCQGFLKIVNPLLSEDPVWASDMFLLDGGVQMANLAMAKWTGNISSLPMGFDKLVIYESKLAYEMTCELILKKKTQRDSVWDINFKNNKDQILAQMTGVRMYLYRVN